MFSERRTLKIFFQKISRSRKNKSNGADTFKDSNGDQLCEINVSTNVGDMDVDVGNAPSDGESDVNVSDSTT